jgi:phage terminase small subunit
MTPLAQLMPGITRCSESTSAVKEVSTLSVLKNPRHERFARELAKGNSATEAYIASGYDAVGAAARVNASRLLTNANISARIAELKRNIAERVIEKTAVTRADILEELKKSP